MIVSTDFAQDVSNAGAKLAPPAGVVLASVSGLSLQQWVFVGTLVYLALQSAHLLWKWWRETKSKSAE